MTQDIFADIREFIVAGIWGDEEADDIWQEEHGDRSDSVWQGESVCESTYAHRGDSSVFQGESVCDIEATLPSYLADRSESVFQGESVCDSSYECRGEESVFEGESVCEPSVAERGAAPLTATSRRPMKMQGPYQAREEDPVDVAIAEYFRLNPQAYSKNRGFIRIEPGHYLLHGREILVEFDKSDSLRSYYLGENGHLVVKDGPLTQPLDDYLMNKEASAEYSGSVFQARNALQTIPQDCRMTFHDTGAGYSRIEAMKVAKEQALTREKAAVMMNKGQQPDTLVESYEKAIDRKLGKKRTQDKTISFTSTMSRTVSNPPLPLQAGYATAGSRRISVVASQAQRSPYLAGGA